MRQDRNDRRSREPVEPREPEDSSRAGSEPRGGPRQTRESGSANGGTSRELARGSAERSPIGERSPLGRRPLSAASSPFALMSQLSQEMDRVFEDFWRAPFSMGALDAPRSGRPPSADSAHGRGGELGGLLWAPDIEVHEHAGELVVRADLPGTKAEEVRVDVTDDVLTIQGERRQGCEDQGEGWHRSECRYGSFFRSLSLPEGIDPEQIRAEFRDGVLEVRMPVPERRERRRSIAVGGGPPRAQGGRDAQGTDGARGAEQQRRESSARGQEARRGNGARETGGEAPQGT